MPTTGTISIRSLPQSCYPPSVRGDYGTKFEASLDNPNEGEVYNIGDTLYRWDGTDFVLLVPPGDHVEIPDAAFADVNNPTTDEAVVWIEANYDGVLNPIARHHTSFYFVGDGTADLPDYVWAKDTANGVYRLIQKPNVISVPIALIDVVKVQPQIITSGQNSFANQVPGTIDNYRWVVTNLSTGATYADINGAAGVDATGETQVVVGTYDSPTWAINDLCTPFQFDLIVTDSNGNVSQTTSVIVTQGGTEATLFFTHDASVDPNFTLDLGFSDDYIATVDLGDGNTVMSNNINYNYGAAQVYNIEATVCVDSLLSVVAPDNALTGTIQTIFGGDISQFSALQEYNFNNNNLSGTIPALDNNPFLVSVQGNNNNFTGSPPTIIGASNLDTYSFNNNALTGTLPYLLANQTIRYFDLGDNNIGGDWHSLAGLESLEYYDISDNAITGGHVAFTGEAFQQVDGNSLVHFDISNNQISDVSFAWASISPGQLEYVDYSNNNFTGTFTFGDFAGFIALRHFDASNNNIAGIHPALTPLTLLEYYDISNNNVGGEAQPLTTNTVIVHYDVSNNNIEPPAVNFSFAPNTLLEVLRYDGNPLYAYTGGDVAAANTALLVARIDGTATALPDSDDFYCDVSVGSGGNAGTLGSTTDGSTQPACVAALPGWTFIVA